MPHQKPTASWGASIAVSTALLAMVASSVFVSPALASPRPPATSTSATAPRDTRTPAQKRYAALLAKQEARFETAKSRQAALAKAAKLPKWKANAHEVINTSGVRPHTTVSPHLATPVTTDPNNWTALGPEPTVDNFGNVYAGEVTAIASPASNTSDLWIATTNGGVWNSTDGGAIWTPTTDQLPTMSFGAIAIDPSNAQVIYAGSGAPTYRSNYPGMGIFKTTDGGAHWTQENAGAFSYADVYRIAIDPSNTQNILAAIGEPYGYGSPTQVGVWQSANGGSTWTEVLSDSANNTNTAAVATDVVFDPANPAIVYAALSNSSGSSATTTVEGIYQSSDHGATWTLLAGGPTGANVGRTSLAISQDGSRLYATIADDCATTTTCGALYNSSIYEYNTSGATWSTISLVGSALDINGELQYGWDQNNVIETPAFDPTGATIYLGAYNVYSSTDSGVNWTMQGSNNSVGYGVYALDFPSAASSTNYVGGNYGIWQYASGYTSKNTTLDISGVNGGVYGDTGAYSPLYSTLTDPTYAPIQYPGGSTGAAVWNTNYNLYGTYAVDWSNNANVYGTQSICTNPPNCTVISTTVLKSTDGASTFNPTSLSTSDSPGYQYNLTISPTHPQTVFYGTTRVWATTDGGTTWNVISPQLDMTPQYGGTCTGPSDTGCPIITQVAVAPTSDNDILVSYSDGQIYGTTDGGASWYQGSLLCAGQAGCQSFSSEYAISPANPSVMYAAGSYGTNTTYASGIFSSTNGGRSWSLLPSSATLPNTYFDSVAISPANPHLILASTYAGSFASFDDGVDWQSVSGLPNVSVTGLFTSHDGSQLIATTYGRGAWAIAMPHLTLSQQAITLTTAAGSSPANQTLTLGNTGQGTLSWSTSGLPSWLALSPSSGSIAPGATQQVTLSFTTPSTTPQTYMTNVTFSGNADNSNISLPVTVSSSLSKTWYFAEGYTGTGFTEYLTLANPNPVAATVTVQYLLQGSAPLSKTYTVNANARRTLNVNTELSGQQIGVSLVVTSDQPIIAERPMYFTFTGQGLNVPGGTDTLGATALGTQYDFGYLDTTANHATYLTVLNPNTSAMTVTVSYYAAGGGSPTVVTHTVNANARGTIVVNNDVPAGTYSALVSLSAPGLVERPLYLVDTVTGYTGSADVIGVQSPSTSWSFAEGFTNPNFSERYYLSNPGTSSATATVTFYKSDGTTAISIVTLSPGAQQVVNANSVLGNGVNNSAVVSSSQPILAERFMSFTYHGPVGTVSSSSIPGATDVLGATSVGQVYDFAEGYTGGSFGEYLTLQNPNATTTQVSVVYLPQSGAAPTVATYFVAAHSRYTILTNTVMPNQSFSMVVLGSAPIVAERPMYFNYNGDTGGSDVVGYQP